MAGELVECLQRQFHENLQTLPQESIPSALAQCLAVALLGMWSDDRRIFLQSCMAHGQGLSIRWGVITEEAHDLGVGIITLEGESIVPFHFAHPWPHYRFRPGRHLLDAHTRLFTVD